MVTLKNIPWTLTAIVLFTKKYWFLKSIEYNRQKTKDIYKQLKKSIEDILQTSTSKNTVVKFPVGFQLK